LGLTKSHGSKGSSVSGLAHQVHFFCKTIRLFGLDGLWAFEASKKTEGDLQEENKMIGRSF
jgi:hypothetical protein